jgi:SAM-dependent methyltransferase
MPASNCYDDARRAAAYAKLEFPGTYYLAYRDLPAIIRTHVKGRQALDFGCGAGRSTRFLRERGFDVVGIDVSAEMIRRARELDPGGEYVLVRGADFEDLRPRRFDLVLAAFTFDNVPTMRKKVASFAALRDLLGRDGRIVNLVSSPDIYCHEWVSFSTRDYPENARARSGDTVRIVVTALEDRRPVEDVLWTDEWYQDVYRRAGLELVVTHRPLGREDEPYPWVNETRIAPWVIYVLKGKTRLPFDRALPQA